MVNKNRKHEEITFSMDKRLGKSPKRPGNPYGGEETVPQPSSISAPQPSTKIQSSLPISSMCLVLQPAILQQSTIPFQKSIFVDITLSQVHLTYPLLNHHHVTVNLYCQHPKE